MLRSVHLLGEMGDTYGKEFKFDVLSVGEALRALDANFPGFIRDIKKDEYYNVVVGDEFIDDNALDENTIWMQHKKGDIWICPAVEGAKRGMGQAILGVVMIVVGVVLSAYGLGVIGAPMIKLGVGMLLSGVVMMLTPVPGSADYKQREKPDERQSFFFDGAVNTNEQGGAIPPVYGQMMVGSTIVSTSLDVEDI